MREYLFEVESDNTDLIGIWVEAKTLRLAVRKSVAMCRALSLTLKSFIPKRIGMELNPEWIQAQAKENK